MASQSINVLNKMVEAVSETAIINHSQLINGNFQKDGSNKAVHFYGKHAVVFAFRLRNQLKAIKIWPMPANKKLSAHYFSIENKLPQFQLPYFTSFEFLPNAITINGHTQDLLLMDWVGRQNIKEYIISNIGESEKLEALAEKLLELHQILNKNGIAHGHLHTGNIYIDAQQNLKLIDYDFLYIGGQQESSLFQPQYPDYYHPSSIGTTSTHPKSDYFPALILYLGVKALTLEPALWARKTLGFQDNFLFTQSDYTDLQNSDSFKFLKKLQSSELDALLEILVSYCKAGSIDNLLPFYELLPVKYLSSKTARPERSLAKPATGKINKPTGIVEANSDSTIKSVSVKDENIFMESSSLGNSAVQQTISSMELNGISVKTKKVIANPTLNKISTKGKAIKGVPIAKKRTNQILLGAAGIGIFITATSYFLGGLADYVNTQNNKEQFLHGNAVTSSEKKQDIKPVVAPAAIVKTIAPAITDTIRTVIAPVDSIKTPSNKIETAKNPKKETAAIAHANVKEKIFNPTKNIDNHSPETKTNLKQAKEKTVEKNIAATSNFEIGAAPKNNK